MARGKVVNPERAMHVYLEGPGSPERFGRTLALWLGPMRNGTKPNTLSNPFILLNEEPRLQHGKVNSAEAEYFEIWPKDSKSLALNYFLISLLVENVFVLSKKTIAITHNRVKETFHRLR